METNIYKYNPLFKKDILNIYYSWININKSLYMKYYNLIGLILMALLIPFDFILYSDNNIYTQARIIYIVIILINFIYIQINQKKLFAKKDGYNIHYTILLPGILFNLLYLYYLSITAPENYNIILLANFVTIITTTMFAMKFWKEQYALNFISILLICPLIYLEIEGSIYLIGFHILSFVSGYLYRRKFIISMYERYYNTASLVPKNVAKYIAMTDGVIELEKIFKPSNRFTVCLSSDWRNFQEIAATKDPEFVENLFQQFYNEVFIEIDRIFPEGNYYADWTADELFIIFFSNDDNDEKLINNALEFAHVFSKDVFNKINKTLGLNLMYDIGMSAGIGLLGLQGPDKLKKTTITGESAGTAKRLETEAKELRGGKTYKNPILIMDKYLYSYAKSLKTFKGNLEEIVATTKDIKDGKYYLYTKK